MGGSKTSVKYKPAPVAPDNSFQQYLDYQQSREQRLEQRAAQERAAAAAREEARRERGRAGLTDLRSNLEGQMRSGLLNYQEAAETLRGYGSRYDIEVEPQAQELGSIFTQELLPGRRSTGTKAAYEEILGRQATDEELTKAKERFSQGYYSSVKDLKDSLYKGQEYKDKFNQSYLENYYDTMFGKQEKTPEGKQSGKRTFTYDAKLQPTYQGDLADKTQVGLTDYADYFGEARTVKELEEGLQGLRQQRSYLFNAGLKNLEGDIQKNVQKLRNEGSQEVQKIRNRGQLMAGLTQGFFGYGPSSNR